MTANSPEQPPGEPDAATPTPFAELQLTGKRVLIVASTGGHLHQATRLAAFVRPAPGSVLVTFDTPQSRSIDIPNVKVLYVPYVHPRDVRGIVRAGVAVARRIRRHPFDAVVSTGAGVALGGMLAGALKPGCRAIYVESVSRFDGPSTTGRIVSHLPGVRTYTQHASWSSRRWRLVHGLTYTASASRSTEPGPPPERIFVTLGTIRPYPFSGLVEKVLASVPPSCELVWQLGETPAATAMRGEVHAYMSQQLFEEQISKSDLVISHAGAGTALHLIEVGVPTVLVPRRASRGEHVDDHQAQLAAELGSAGMIRYLELNDVTPTNLGF